MSQYKKLYEKYNHKLTKLIKQIGGLKENEIFSIGFEMQSSDFYTIIFTYNKDKMVYEARYATNNDIPYRTMIDLFNSNDTSYKVQLDAVGLEEIIKEHDSVKYLKLLEDFRYLQLTNDKYIHIMESIDPLDTEITTLNLNTEYLMRNESDIEIDYTEMLKSHFQLQIATFFYYNFRDNYTKIEYETYQKKYNILYVPNNLQNDNRKYIGFFHANFINPNDSDNINRINLVPQVTFQCTLKYAYYIIMNLVTNTPENIFTNEIKLIDTYVREKFKSDILNDVISFIFLINYYYVTMQKYHNKQNLGFAVRHNFINIFLSFDENTRNLLKNFTPDIDTVSHYETIDGVNRYPYSNNGNILIEYRLFGYIISGKNDDNSINIVLL